MIENYDKIIAFIKENPDAGRRVISKEFGISQYQAMLLKKKVYPEMGVIDVLDGGKVDRQKFLRYIKSPTQKRTMIDICNKFNITPRVADEIINELVEQQYMINTDTNAIIVEGALPDLEIKKLDMSRHGVNEYAFGAISDTHIGSKYERLDALCSLYDRFAEEGIEHVFHAGNWIDGENRYNKNDLYVHGLDNQVKNFIDKYPLREGIKTHIISGDCHEGVYATRLGINIGKYMEMKARDVGRTDLMHAGHLEKDYDLMQKNGGARLRLIHPGGGSAYAVSYSSQKYVEMLQRNDIPDIVLVGHFHKFDYSYPREVHVIQVGCLQDQTPFMRKRRLQAAVGGCIIRVKQANNGMILSLNVEWIPFYDKKFYEYKW